MNFFTGFQHGGHSVFDQKEIAKHYLEKWFWVDIFASLPFEQMFEGSFDKKNRKAVKFLKLFKLPKLLRLGRLLRYLKQYFKFRHLLTYSFTLVVIAHWTACWYGIIQEEWVTASVDKWLAYLVCIDKAFLFMFKGYREHQTQAHEYFFTVTVTLCGTIFMGFLSASLVVVLQSVGGPWEKFRQKQELVFNEMDDMNISEETQKKVKRYYDYLWVNRKASVFGSGMFGDSDLSPALKKEIGLQLVDGRVNLRGHRMLQNFSDDALSDLISMMTNHHYMPGDYVCRQGERGAEMWYIVEGEVEVFIEPIQIDNIFQLQKGTMFGEMALLTNQRRTASVRAVNVVECASLSKERLLLILHRYPENEVHLQNFALETIRSEQERMGAKFMNHAVLKALESRYSLFTLQDRVQAGLVSDDKAAAEDKAADSKEVGTSKVLHPSTKEQKISVLESRLKSMKSSEEQSIVELQSAGANIDLNEQLKSLELHLMAMEHASFEVLHVVQDLAA